MDLRATKWVAKSAIKHLYPDQRFGEWKDNVRVMQYFAILLDRSPCYVEEIRKNIRAECEQESSWGTQINSKMRWLVKDGLTSQWIFDQRRSSVQRWRHMKAMEAQH